MADNYTQATVTPLIPKALITDAELDILGEEGLSYDECVDGLLYFYAEEGFADEETLLIFQRIIDRYSKGVDAEGKVLKNITVDEDIDEIIMEGAFTCSKMRSGEFGGFVVRVTKDNIRGMSTSQMLDMIRAEIV